MTHEQMKKQLVAWLGEFRFGFDCEMEDKAEDARLVIRIRIYTFTNKYSISAYAPGDTTPGYLGCIARTRKPRAGEDWTRGRDLADGPFSRETWNKVLADIVAYETVKIHRRTESEEVEKTLTEPSVAPTGC